MGRPDGAAQAVNWLERKFARLAWGRLEAKMPQIKRWVPLLAAGFLVVGILLRAFGQHGAAAALDGLLGAVNLTGQSPVSAAELTAGLGVLTGIGLKLRSEYVKARAAK